MAWIRIRSLIRMAQKFLLGSGLGTWKIQSWILIWNKSFRIHITEKKNLNNYFLREQK